MQLLAVVFGIALLYLGGEWLVRGAVGLGRRFRLSSTVLGLTVVSFGTSSPELAASLAGVLEGAPAVAFGNIVGSNIANLGLVLGLTLLIRPVTASGRFLRREIPFMLLASVLLFAPVWSGLVSRAEGLLLTALLGVYLVYLFGGEAGSPAGAPDPGAAAPRTATRSVLEIVAGIALLVVGADLLVVGAVGVARWAGISERVIGLTMVAFGTSLPELATSLVAAARREGEIVLGNLIGSNVFNILFILGVTAAVRPVAVAVAESLPDLLVMLSMAVLVWLFVLAGPRLGRAHGATLLLGYVAYVVFLFV